MLRFVVVSLAVVAAVAVPGASGATVGTYAGSLYQGGSRVEGSNARLVVRAEGTRFTLRARRMKL